MAFFAFICPYQLLTLKKVTFRQLFSWSHVSKLFYNQTFFNQFFWINDLFGPRIFLANIFLTQKLLDPKISKPKIFLAKSFLDPKFLYQNFFAYKIVESKKISGLKVFLHQNFWTKNFIGHKNLRHKSFGLKFVLDKILMNSILFFLNFALNFWADVLWFNPNITTKTTQLPWVLTQMKLFFFYQYRYIGISKTLVLGNGHNTATSAQLSWDLGWGKGYLYSIISF